MIKSSGRVELYSTGELEYVDYEENWRRVKIFIKGKRLCLSDTGHNNVHSVEGDFIIAAHIPIKSKRRDDGKSK